MIGVRSIIGAMVERAATLIPSRYGHICCPPAAPRLIGQDLYDPKIAAMMKGSQTPKPPPNKKQKTEAKVEAKAEVPPTSDGNSAGSGAGSGANVMADFKKKLDELRSAKAGGAASEGGEGSPAAS